MKKIIAFTVILFLIKVVYAQNKEAYIQSMEKQVRILDTAYTVSTMQQVYNSLERISNVDKDEWLPPYYMAYCLVMQSYTVPVKTVDEMCDRADALLNKADSISPNNSEIYVVRSMIASARIRVNPMTRGAKFGAKSADWLNKAEQIDTLNPRIAFIRGQGIYYTPPAFGGGKEKAKPILEEAVKKYALFKPSNTIAPRWGRERTNQLLAECNK